MCSKTSSSFEWVQDWNPIQRWHYTNPSLCHWHFSLDISTNSFVYDLPIHVCSPVFDNLELSIRHSTGISGSYVLVEYRLSLNTMTSDANCIGLHCNLFLFHHLFYDYNSLSPKWIVNTARYAWNLDSSGFWAPFVYWFVNVKSVYRVAQ